MTSSRPVLGEVVRGVDNLALAATHASNSLANLKDKFRHTLTELLDVETPEARYQHLRNRVVYGGIHLGDAIAELAIIGPRGYGKDVAVHTIGLATALFNRDFAKAKAALKGIFVQTPMSALQNFVVKPRQAIVQGKQVEMDRTGNRNYDERGETFSDDGDVFSELFMSLDNTAVSITRTTGAIENLRARIRNKITDIIDVGTPSRRYHHIRNRVVYTGVHLGDAIGEILVLGPTRLIKDMGVHTIGLAAALYDGDRARAKEALRGAFIQTPWSVIKNLTVQPFNAFVRGRKVDLDLGGRREYDVQGNPL